MNNGIHNGSRANYRAKRKKTNLVLNSLIVLVLALILVVAFVIFSGGKNKTAKRADAKNTEQSDSSVQKKKPEGSSQNNQNQQSNDTTADSGTDQQSQDSTTDSGTGQQSQDSTTTGDGQSADPANEVVSDGGSTQNVAKTIENPDWKPVGTSQTGKHAAVYDSNSVDWQEMLNAISAGTGIARDNMTIWRLGSNQKDPNHSIATISSKDEKKPYRVYIEWVDGQGWKPTKVEELSVNDKGSSND